MDRCQLVILNVLTVRQPAEVKIMLKKCIMSSTKSVCRSVIKCNFVVNHLIHANSLLFQSPEACKEATSCLVECTEVLQ